MTSGAVLDRERRWAVPAGLAALGAVAFVMASIIVASSALGGGSGEAEYLKNVDAHQTARMVAAVLQGIGVALLAVPLHYLFRAAAARSERVRGQLVGVVIAGPIFLAIASVLTGISALHAADDFVSTELPRLLAKGVKVGSDRANEVATETSNEASLRPLAAGFGIGGQLGFVIGMAYTALHAMRTGLLTRFWGSLGVALGVISFFSIFFQLALLWYVYLGVLILGRVPRGRPPAWEAGRAIPWPTPGERASAELSAGGKREPGGEAEPEEAPSEEPPRPRS
jgi:hypothetical protein